MQSLLGELAPGPSKDSQDCRYGGLQFNNNALSRAPTGYSCRSFDPLSNLVRDYHRAPKSVAQPMRNSQLLGALDQPMLGGNPQSKVLLERFVGQRHAARLYM